MGFFVPGSMSSSFVANQRNEQGGLAWDTKHNQIGLQGQSALQALNKQHSQLVNDAYTSYTQANRAVRGSNMGQGFMEQYTAHNQEMRDQHIAESSLNAGLVRQQIEGQVQQMQMGVEDAFRGEVRNMDRFANLANEYLSYLRTLMNADGSQWMAPEQWDPINQTGYDLDHMWDIVLGHSMLGAHDIMGNHAQTMVQWLHAQMRDTQADREWTEWLQGGGWAQGNQAAAGATQQRFSDSPAAVAQREQAADLARRQAEWDDRYGGFVGALRRIASGWNFGSSSTPRPTS